MFNAKAELKVAVQVMAAVTVTLPSVQSALPVQPAKVEPEAGVAVKVTSVPLLRLVVQVLPQFISGGTAGYGSAAGSSAGYRQRICGY